MRLTVKTRKALFNAIQLVESSPKIDEIRKDIERLVWMAVSKEHAPAFVERLEGWWFDLVVKHLLDQSSYAIPIDALCNKVLSLREQFKLDNLPDDLVNEAVPQEELDENDPRVFVRQLRYIGVGPGRVRKAQENHYKAATQRSRWIRDKMIDMDELDKFELNLIDEWDEFFVAFHDGLDDADPAALADAAVKLYEWSQAQATANPTLFIRPLFRSAYLTRGSYHMLSEQVRLGWHRDYDKLFRKT
jgi:hypothetical protein